MNKKKILTIALCAALVAALVIGGSLAYFTDTKQATNVFTVGNVKIELYESQLHRVNAGVTSFNEADRKTNWEAYRLVADTTEFPFDGTDANTPDHKANPTYWETNTSWYSDEYIIANSGDVYKQYLEDTVLMPGTSARKNPYVKNTGSIPAYVRVRVLIPKVLDDDLLADSMYVGTAIANGAVGRPVVSQKTVNDILYTEYAFTYLNPLEPGAMTFWNCWADIKVSETATAEQIQALVDSGDITVDNEGGLHFNVLVQADGIQADNFANATAAFAAFDAQMNP